MNRREILKGFGAIALSGSFPAVLDKFATAAAAERLEPQFFSAEEFATLENLVDIILPETQTPGGLATQTPAFIDLVVKDCLSLDDQERIRQGLKGLNSAAGKSFVKLGGNERAALVGTIDEKAFGDDPASVWLRIVKKLALIGHFTSREGMTKALRYVKIPGRYEGCVPYKKGDRSMAKTFLMYW